MFVLYDCRENIPHLSVINAQIQQIHDELVNFEGKLPKLELIASRYGMTVRAMNTAFKKKFGKSIYAHISCSRLHKNLFVNNINGQRHLPESNDGSSQVIESQEAACKLLLTHEQFAKAIEPAVRDLDDPASGVSAGVSSLLFGLLATAFDMCSATVFFDALKSVGAPV